jgi:conjugal transfer/entry exclusion protein
MLLEKIESLEAEIIQLHNLMDNTANEDNDADQQLRDDVARIKHMLFGDPYPVNNSLDER